MTAPPSVLAANGAKAPAQTLTAFALRFRQKRPDVNLYVTALPLRELLGRFRADTYRTGKPEGGYQRPLTPSRLRQLSAYMRVEEGMLPTSILLCIRQPDRAVFEPLAQEATAGQAGMISINGSVPLGGVDGQ